MATAVFDTLKASDTLKAAGVEAKQAEAIVHTMAGAFEDTVATNADLIEVKADLRQEIASTKAELKQDIASTRADIAIVKGDIRLLKWMIGVVLACVVFPILKSFLL
jgi:hypothetical protein